MLLCNENAISSGNYQIKNSLRFQSASSQYLSRTFSTPTNTNVWTWNGWVKLGAGFTLPLIGTQLGTTLTSWEAIYIGTNIAYVSASSAGANSLQKVSNAVYRDPSAFYNIVIQKNASAASGVGCIRIWINNVEITSWSTNGYTGTQASVPNLINTAIPNYLGAYYNLYADGYLSEVVFVDGQALTPSSFGTTDATSGQWVAKKYTGTYGTNGFYLPFSNGTSTTTLGNDSSGNGNNWTLTNFTRSAGVSDCWMNDVPSGNGYGPATQPSSNYPILNPLRVDTGTKTLASANLKVTLGTLNANSGAAVSMDIPLSGKWYWEVTVSTLAQWSQIGIIQSALVFPTLSSTYAVGFSSTSYAYVETGQKFTNNTASAYGSSYTTGDVIGVAFDADAGTLDFYKNNTSQGTAFTGLTGAVYSPAISGSNSGVWNANFGQRSFAYTPPSGFKALCTANLPTATIKQGNKYMDATLYSGNSSTQTITNAGSFKPDLVWVKSRSAATDHKLTDSVRGATKALISDTTGAETTDTTGLTAFNSNGFTLGASTVYNNGTGPATYVGWQWQAGQGSTSSNTNGSITSTVSVNTTAGFSIVTYTGNGTTGATIGHGLGVAPKMIIVKTRSTGDWITYHASLGATKYIEFNLTNAATTSASSWNNTSPTSTVFTVNYPGSGTWTNSNTVNYVAYCFSEIAGFSSFGSYTGNGSTDGTFIYTGFRPKFVITKLTSAVGSDWAIKDSVRNPYNAANNTLLADLSNAELTSNGDIDLLSNGFKIRTTNVNQNTSGATYIYMAFAENPFAQSNAR